MKKTVAKSTTMKKSNGGDDKYQQKLRNTYKSQTGKDAPKGANLVASSEENARKGTGAYKVYIKASKPSPLASQIKPKPITSKKKTK